VLKTTKKNSFQLIARYGVGIMPRKMTFKRPQVNIVLSAPQLTDVQLIMEDRGIMHLSDYMRQLVARDIRQWRSDHHDQFVSASQQNTPEFQSWLKWKQGEKQA